MLIALRRKIGRVRAMTAAQRGVFLQSIVLLPWFALGLRTFGFARMHKSLVLRHHSAASVLVPLGEIEALAEAVRLAASQSPFAVSCLVRSLLLCWLLQRRQVASQLRIGVRLDGAVLHAHAWVECNGVPVNDARDIAARFAAFADPIPERAFQA
jgi:hypothetical protein